MVPLAYEGLKNAAIASRLGRNPERSHGSGRDTPKGGLAGIIRDKARKGRFKQESAADSPFDVAEKGRRHGYP